MRKLKFIINADDLGENSNINQAIKDFAEKRLISSSTILANGEDFEGARQIVRDCNHISVGAHLNLTQFESLSKPDIFIEKGIVNEKGVFTGIMKFSVKNKIEFSPVLNEAIYRELSMQLEKLLDNKIPLSHIDGHNHVHYHRGLFHCIKKLQKTYGIKKIRVRNVKPLSFYGIYNTAFTHKTPPLRNEINNILWNLSVNYFQPSSITVDFVFSYISLYKYLLAGCELPKKGVFEIIAHPGSNYLEYFTEENMLIQNRTLESLIPDFAMINYNEL